MTQKMETKQKELEYLKKKEQMLRIKSGLPHLYGWNWYQWAYDFFHSFNSMCLICAANQVSKSTTQIRKYIHWATCPDLWYKLWPSYNGVLPIWYLYPTREVALYEFEEKWEKEILPRGEFRDHSIYGWHAQKTKKEVSWVRFNSGGTIFFKSYEQDVHALQTATVGAIGTDEELPVDLLSELQARLMRTDGYFSMVFTATRGQEYWRQVMEGKGKQERLPNAFKRQISLYDCMHYMDGKPSIWTKEKIEKEKTKCKDEAEVDRRINGRFVIDKNRVYSGFVRHINYVKGHNIPKSWLVYSGVDVGSGGGRGHPAGIIFVGVKPNFTAGRVFKGWRGDGIITTASDILHKYRDLRGIMRPVSQYYDHASKDFHTISLRMGECFQPADKDRARGEQILNVLFRSGMLKIYEDEQLEKLAIELENLKSKTAKENCKDDLVDALRYAISNIPWDFSSLLEKAPPVKDPYAGMSERMRRHKMEQDGVVEQDEEVLTFQREFDEVNEAYEYYGYGEESFL